MRPVPLWIPGCCLMDMIAGLLYGTVITRARAMLGTVAVVLVLGSLRLYPMCSLMTSSSINGALLRSIKLMRVTMSSLMMGRF